MRKALLFMAVAFALSAGATTPETEGCSIDQPKAQPCATTPQSYGLLASDVIVSIDGVKVDPAKDRKSIEARLTSGSVKRVVVLRNGQRKTLKLAK